MSGLYSRRKQPIGPFFVDFFAPPAKLTIELDGPFHDRPGAPEYDAARTGWFQMSGCRVLRFRNEQLQASIEAVLEAILTAAGAPPSLTLPLKGGGDWVEALPPSGGGK